MTNTCSEVVIFRYIPKELAKTFAYMLNEWGVSLLARERTKTDTTHAESGEPSPSAPVNLWDYPDYEEERKSAPLIMQKVAQQKNFRLSLTELNDIHIVYIKDEPEHYPYSYILVFQFNLKVSQLPKDKYQILDQLNQATWEIKKFTDIVSIEAPYRPVYWFFSDLPEHLTGIRGTPLEVHTPDGNLPIKIERGFPYASYIIYGICPSQADLRFTDLGLVSVIAHAMERGYRQQLYTLTQQILSQAVAYETNKHDTPNKTIEELKEEIK